MVQRSITDLRIHCNFFLIVMRTFRKAAPIHLNSQMLTISLVFLINVVSYIQAATLPSSGDESLTSSRQRHDWNSSDNKKLFLNSITKPADFSERKVDGIPLHLRTLSLLLGKWRSEFGGKAQFPTMPMFTYGEQVEFGLFDDKMHSITAINYSAVAWDYTDQKELHSENGFIIIAKKSEEFWLNTVMNSGFITAEEGRVWNNTISFVMKRIGRLGFSRDMPVRQMLRTWQFLDINHLEAKLWMSTFTHHRLMPHTSVIYTRTFS